MSQQQRPAVFDLVAEDVRTGLSKYFEVGDVRFVAPTDSDQPLSNDGHDAVAWECDCVDAKVFPDLEPSQQSFVADGITIVSKATGGTAPTFRRYVDWNRIIGQLGENVHRRSTKDPHVLRMRAARRPPPAPESP